MMGFLFNRLGFFISDIISPFVRLIKLGIHLDFLKRALQRVEEQRQLRALAGGARSTNKSNGKSQRDEV